jgi:hypothetical protein
MLTDPFKDPDRNDDGCFLEGCVAKRGLQKFSLARALLKVGDIAIKRGVVPVAHAPQKEKRENFAISVEVFNFSKRSYSSDA